MSKIIIPYLNPVKFHKLTPDESAKYLTRHMEEWNYSNATPDWQAKPIYAQPFQVSDNITLQFQSNFDEADQTVELINCHGRVFLTFTVTQGAESETEAGLFLYEINEALTDIEDGYYYIRITGQGTPDLEIVSEPLHIKSSHPYSVLIEYSNFEFKDGIVFETDLVLQIRVHGDLRYKIPASKDVSYEDQSFDTTLLNSVPYRIWELYVGGTTGIPSYLIDRINRLLGCSNLQVDGKYFTKSDGAKLEEKASDDERYPLRGWTIDLQEAENPYAAEFSTEGEPTPVTPTQLTTPSLVLTVNSSSQITATWGAITNASYYTFLRSTQPFFLFAKVVYSGTNLSHVSTVLTAGKRYYYWLRAEGVDPYLPSDYDTADAVTDAAAASGVALAAPSLTLSTVDSDSLSASWPSIANSTGYELYINTTNNFPGGTPVYSGTGTSTPLDGLTEGTTYYGWARALGNGTTYLNSDYGTDFANTDPFDPTAETFDTILIGNGVNDADEGVNAFFPFQFFASDREFHFNKATTITGMDIRLSISVSGTVRAVVDFPSCYSGTHYKFVDATGTPHYGTFPNQNFTQAF